VSHVYKKFVQEKVAGLVDNAENIRNCTVIAHIDHGKTTLTDSLIAASGLLSDRVAAKARLLDYDMIEQERGITIKASGISLLHEREGRNHLIHLIDTPGHIDFSSHVTRGLRLTDGAIVVVDVIEGIMVQTETVSRQAMQELVRPMLFINKIDRLVNEKQLGAKEIASEISKVTREFNGMLGKYLDDELLEQWEVSFNKNSLVIGSALDKWGVSVSTLLQNTKGNASDARLAEVFLDILNEVVNAYRGDNEDSLHEKYPVAPVLLDSLVEVIPNPPTAQSYRMERIWEGDVGSEAARPLLDCDPEGPVVILVGNVEPDRHAGTVATVRVFSGTLDRAAPLRNLRSDAVDKSLQVGISMVKSRIALPSIPAGNLAFVTGIKGIAIGDTLVGSDAEMRTPMRGLQYPTEPVVTYTVEPQLLRELTEIQEPIAEFAKTDPALDFFVNQETGEMLLSGAGELHIEIAVEKLARQGIRIRLGEPLVLLKEQMTMDGTSSTAGTESTSQFTVRARVTPEDASVRELGTMIASHPPTSCYLIDQTGEIEPYGDETEWIREAFDAVRRNGPVAGERMRKVTLLLEKAQVRMESVETSWRDITQPLVKAARESIKKGKPRVLEPWTRLEISAPEDYVGTTTSILARRKGRIIEIDSEKMLYHLKAEIPVRESFGLANELRTSTSGWVTWGAKPGEYREMGAS
jgi:elongation factor 2